MLRKHTAADINTDSRWTHSTQSGHDGTNRTTSPQVSIRHSSDMLVNKWKLRRLFKLLDSVFIEWHSSLPRLDNFAISGVNHFVTHGVTPPRRVIQMVTHGTKLMQNRLLVGL